MRLPRRTGFLSTTLILSLLAMTTAAADSTTAAAAETTTLPNLSSEAASASSAATQTTAAATASDTTAASSGTDTGISITATGTADSTSTDSSVPTVTSSGLPKLTSAYTIVPASVPPTANAPYMQVSSLPEDSVFIIVGAILGFCAFSILAWRMLVAWSLHRAVKRANQAQYMSTAAKANFRAPPAPFYKYTDRPDSTISLSGMAGGKGGKKGGRPPSSGPAAASASSLFFSPTAGAVSNSPGNRGSNYLPAGYYAAGASAPGNGQNTTHIGSGTYQSNISMSNLDPRPQSRGCSPSGSPAWNAGHSSSTLNLNQPPGDQRAPSLYLEDLMDGSGGLPPQHNQRYSSSGRPF